MGPPARYGCCVCKKQVKGKIKRPVSKSLMKILREKGLHIDKNSQICNPCRLDIAKQVQGRPKTTANSVTIPFCSAGKSHSKCAFCDGKINLKIIPTEARIDSFVMFGLLVPVGCKCCPKHLIGKNLNPNQAIDVTSYRKKMSSLTSQEVSDLLTKIRTRAMHNLTTYKLDFENLHDEDYMTLLGLSKENFFDITSFTTSLRNTKMRSIKNAIGILLFKLKSGLSNGILATLCGMRTRRQVAEVVKSARVAMVKDFVPLNLGFQHVSRDRIVNHHTTDISKQLFTDPISDTVVLVLDGTYIYIQKSSSYKFQRLTYSMHKNRPLVKPFIITATDGYIVDVVGPFFANGRNNDASILSHIVQTNAGNFMGFLKEHDVLVVDRGFRDSVHFLQECGFQIEMPSFLSKTSKQHSTAEANSSRLVTKIRWVVEAVNVRIKKWQYLNNVVHNSQIPYIGDFVRIVCSVINKYRPPIKTNDDDDLNLGFKMLLKSRENANALKQLCTRNHAHRFTVNSKSWKSIDAHDAVLDFPVLSEDEVRQLIFGVYQIRQANSYVREHTENGQYNIDVSEIETGLIHTRIQSRHRNSTLYNLWIKYTTSSVCGWYCQCKSGARTVGCCAHVCRVIWYLGYSRRQCNYTVRAKDQFISSIRDAGANQTDSDELSD
ncbi:uncharacterized protein LOC133181135 [Saccostrea echinata]|uniref:uncharacterized protein LOC133181135 n=1 Tax=Saccostrea echinata TaxID=191078 RepID=UPI002A7FC76C|nr:uncharacterized protein LOC133181135 [Saccostrea echinata]